MGAVKNYMHSEKVFARRPRLRSSPNGMDLASGGTLIRFNLMSIPKVCLQTASFWNTEHEHIFLPPSSIHVQNRFSLMDVFTFFNSLTCWYPLVFES